MAQKNTASAMVLALGQKVTDLKPAVLLKNSRPYLLKTPVSGSHLIIPPVLTQAQTDGGKLMEAVVHHMLAG
ncbi:MAG: hypothetical protein MIO93_02750 [ANME-2 cluster archaeon]|nr:hypothetical protein [ANME-2 cluster archaeon]